MRGAVVGLQVVVGGNNADEIGVAYDAVSVHVVLFEPKHRCLEILSLRGSKVGWDSLEPSHDYGDEKRHLSRAWAHHGKAYASKQRKRRYHDDQVPDVEQVMIKS